MTKATCATPARGTGKGALLRRAAVAVFLSGTAVCTTIIGQASAQSYAFTQVEIEGNDRVDAASILRFAGIGRGQQVSAAELNDAYQRIVNSGLFETVELAPQGGTLVIKVKEYPTINIVNFEGNRRIKDEQLAEIAQSKSRRIYSPAQAEQDAANITEAYRQSGRLAVTVEPRIIRRSDNRVDLVFEVAEGRVVENERISFVGNRDYSDRRLRQVLETKQAGILRTFIQRDTFVADRIELDKQLLRDFYLSRGYIDFQVLDATAELARERDATFVTFTVREGQSFRFGQISASSEIDEIDAAEFEALLRIRPGVTYSPSIVENNIARLENLALRKGLNFVRVEPRISRNDRDQTLDVDFVLTRGQRIFVERIDIEGNTTTLDEVVRRQFTTVEGDPFNPRAIRQSAERIRALGFFSDARVEAEQGSGPDQVVVNVDVEEQPTGSLSFGASYSVSNGVGVNVGLTETNFLGRGQTVGINVSSGTDSTSSSLYFKEPALLGRDLEFTFNSYYNVTDNENSFYDTRRIGIIPSIEFPIGEFSRLQLRYSMKKDTVRSVDRGMVDDPATPEDETSNGSSRILLREERQGSPFSSSIGYTFSYDTRIGGQNPNGGILLRFGQDFAGVGGDIESVTTSALALAETKVFNEDVTLRAVVEGGAIKMLNGGTSRVTDRFFGNGKIRGFEPNGIGPRDLTATNEDALGGNLFAVARFEAEFPLGLPEEYGLTGGVFADVGSVWSLDDVRGTAGPVDDGLNLRSAVGVSLFWTTAIGPLRFNFSRAINKETYDKEQNFDLTISTKF
ncbi:outer membrane protein assembly factor BamA [Aliigemmobacter aestuarii]|uniref:Outer membrane protein assembly factor BamA n=1 Tax=Aliigemmobacter aestuarii TaxID=1445661 RepID=A0A4S3MQV3_9RHOB|nr:outer membrane protein assembly factor BamA [Gemmobacter aestuarii]THD84474.1 outer membrane protein assembly factor BamA [Gemmobacter aestuarii]